MLTSALRQSVLGACAVLSVGTIVAGQAERHDVLVRLGTHVDAWERELGSVVADEIYQQTVARLPRSGVIREANKPPQETRELRSEFTLVHFDEGASDWMGFRSVTHVGGKAVTAPGPSLTQLMNDATLTWNERWTRVRDMSAAFNLGSIARDVNIPTFALAALRTVNQTRFSFAKPRSDTVDGEALTRLDFRERARPTLVSGLGGRNVPLEGTVWLSAPGWRVRRTEIRLRDRLPLEAGGGQHEVRDEELTTRITVSFGPDPNVGTWVPIEMRERYDNSWGEVTTGRASYTNYRRFRTSGRIVRPGA